MKYRCCLALILVFLTSPATLSQTKSPSNENQQPAVQLTPAEAEELKQAQEVAERFIKRFRETRDLTPMVSEMFSGNFQRLLSEDTSWSGIVGVERSLVEHLSEEERHRCYAVAFSLEYLIRLYMAGKVPVESTQPLRNVWSPELEKFFTEHQPLDGNIKTEKQARKYLAFLERAMVVMQKEVLKNPPEETEQFKKNLLTFEKHLQEYKNEQPAVWVSDQAEHGQPPRTRFAKFIIPFHVGLLMVKENGKYKIWLALAHIPPD